MIQLKTRKEKLYAAMQQAANQRQLELAKDANVEKLVSHVSVSLYLIYLHALERIIRLLVNVGDN